MYRLSLREFLVFFFGICSSFATGFLPIEKFGELGAVIYFSIIGVLLTGIWAIAINLVKRLAITIGVLFTVAAAIAVFIRLTDDASVPKDPGLFVFLVGMLGIGPLLVTVPLTIHRLTGSITRK